MGGTVRTRAEDVRGPGRAPLSRWLASNVATAAPQAMAPIAFGLATLGASDSIDVGAAIVTAMIAAQIVGAVPVARLGLRLRIRPGVLLRVLIAFRSLMLGLLVLAVLADLPIPVLLAAAALSGLVSGTVLGLLRAVANELVEPARLPRLLGVLATVNELMFVVGPVVASTLGAVSAPAALGLMTLSAAVPLVLLPRLGRSVPLDPGHREPFEPGVRGRLVLWLVAAGCGSSVVAGIEVGAVALAVTYDLAPTQALVFTIPLCLASIAGGVVISVRSRSPRIRTVVVMLLTTTLGSALLAFGPGLVVGLTGTLLVGVCLAPLATFYSLSLDTLLPPERRVEGFALLRTAQSLGAVVAGLLLTLSSSRVTLTVAAVGTLLAAGLVVLLARRPVGSGGSAPPTSPGGQDLA